MRLPNTAHTERPWRIHEVAPDFRVQDVWDLPTPGGQDDLDRLVQILAPDAGTRQAGTVVRALMSLRWQVGRLVGWDKPRYAVGARTRSLRERLPPDLRDRPESDTGHFLFTPIYQTHEEWAGEYADQILHAILHLGWVPDGSPDGYHAQMTVRVKTTGWVGTTYIMGIRPFRRFLVYPSMLRSLGQRWQRQTTA